MHLSKLYLIESLFRLIDLQVWKLVDAYIDRFDQETCGGSSQNFNANEAV
jgi:hypothetical protein